MAEEHKSLAELRRQVREVDERLFQLLAERQGLAKRIGAVKLASNLPIKDYRVEKDVIERARGRGRDLGVYEELTADVASTLIKYAVMVQDEYRQQQHHQAAVSSKRVLIAGGGGRMGRWLSEYFESFGHAVSHVDPAPSVDSDYPTLPSLTAGAHDHEVIVLAAPISATPQLLSELTAACSKALIFDICSLKTPLLPAIAAAQAAGLAVSSAHPMFGPDVDVLSGRNIIICDSGDPAVTARARALFEGTTANLVTMPLARHDELMSYVLGLSHLTNLVFMDVLRRSGIAFAALNAASSTTFNAQLSVATQVVGENPDLYFEIQAHNKFSKELLSTFKLSLEQYGASISQSNRTAFCEQMAAGRAYLQDGES